MLEIWIWISEGFFFPFHSRRWFHTTFSSITLSLWFLLHVTHTQTAYVGMSRYPTWPLPLYCFETLFAVISNNLLIAQFKEVSALIYSKISKLCFIFLTSYSLLQFFCAFLDTVCFSYNLVTLLKFCIWLFLITDVLSLSHFTHSYDFKYSVEVELN